ncbi:Auxin response factor [Abeliophyllum distichum]|uniref:Auxin response factor n=1 Tax=Abeliophyllum distichum TaxID=126358 RepID=A0ABD1P8S5_9LAMI
MKNTDKIVPEEYTIVALDSFGGSTGMSLSDFVVRASSSEIIVPYHKFLKSLGHSFSAGMRFKMRFETEDAAERRCSGLIIGVSDLDPVRWPGSKWRCLLVRWDDMEGNRHTRVSPWEIEPSGSVSGHSSFVVPGTKRTRVSLPTTKPDFSLPGDGNEVSDLGEPSRFQKVLQDQEVFCFSTLHGELDTQSQRLSEMRCFPGFRSSMISGLGSNIRHLQEDSEVPSMGMGFDESLRFCEVLQGQETSSSLPYGKGAVANQFQENIGSVQLPIYGSNWSARVQGYTQMHHSAPLVHASSPSSVLLFQQPSSPSCNLQALHFGNQKKRETSSRDSDDDFERYARECEPFQSGSTWNDLQRNGPPGQSEEYNQIVSSYPRRSQNLVSMCKKGCRLFGFSLIDGKHAASKEDNSTESPTSYNHGTKFSLCNEEQVHPRPPMPTKKTKQDNKAESKNTKVFMSRRTRVRPTTGYVPLKLHNVDSASCIEQIINNVSEFTRFQHQEERSNPNYYRLRINKRLTSKTTIDESNFHTESKTIYNLYDFTKKSVNQKPRVRRS